MRYPMKTHLSLISQRRSSQYKTIIWKRSVFVLIYLDAVLIYRLIKNIEKIDIIIYLHPSFRSISKKDKRVSSNSC